MAEREGDRRERAPRQPKNVADFWVAALRKQSRESDESNNLNPPKQRPARMQTAPPAQRPLSSNPSLFSLESNLISPATTNSQPFSYSQAPAPAPPPRQSTHEHRHDRHESRAHEQRHSSHPEQRHKNSSSKSHNSFPNPSPSRHREQLDKVYAEPRYDAEFDRALPSTSRTTHSSTAPPRTLFGATNGNASSSTLDPLRHRDKDDSRRPRSKRDQIELGDLGGKRGNNSRESIESEDSGRPGSRSSKEARHRRKREGEKERPQGEITATSPATLMSPPASTAPSRQLFDPRRDDPVKFSHGNSSTRKNSAPSIVSVASCNNSNAAHPNSDLSSRPELESDGRQDPNSAVTQLRRAYREITELETKLQEEHKAAFVSATREEEAAQGLRAAGVEKKYDDAYWVNLATGHKQLADAHYSFLQIALDPRLPSSLHSLPQKYNIPTRLWQTAFHQLLERMRHAITSPSTPSSGNADSTNVLEHLIEFIQYAYGHYSQLFEDPSVAVFRSAWIEQLGDLARYRMAVAGLASRVSAAQSRSNGGGTLFEPQFEREARPIDAASIGDAALGDWEVEEQESWRVMARDWYSQGIAESPGSGRLQHHLALLSKGDELRGLYHYSKSLCAAHPYSSARESILPLFDDELQARRTRPDVTKAELFVHLHGMLFTKISLDDFDECLERFLERLAEEALLSERKGADRTASGAFGDAEWFMIAVINIASMLQYGADDGVLKKAMSKESTESPTKHEGRGSNQAVVPKSKPPQAIMLNPSSLKRETLSEESEDGQETKRSRADDVVKQLNGATSSDTKQEDPPVFRHAQRLSFRILDLLLQHPYRHVGTSKIINPYIVLLLTFLSHLAQYPSALHSLERAVPWSRLAAFYNTIPSSIELKMDAPTKLVGSPLPEDWCIRGMDWIGRNLFSRGHWRSNQATSKRDEMPPIGPVSSSLESEMDALRLDLSTIDEYLDEGIDPADVPSVQLARGRWERIALTAAWTVRSVPGFDYNASARGNATRFAILGNLEAKIRRWKREDDEIIEAERLSSLSAWNRGAVEIEEEEMSDEEEDEEDVNDSAVVRELKSRRRQLKAVIRQARQATRNPPRSPSKSSGAKAKKFKSGRSTANVFAGFTVLVFDTNILLASMKLFQKLVESESWTIVVPLAVITELDGLRRNDSALGTAAEVAVLFLESAISRYSRYLKVQTSRGNYLKDLAIRSENIDFAGELDSPGAFSHDSARNMDDVILKAVGWQKDHFTSRLALVNPRIDRKSVPADAAKVILVTADGNLRLKARARGLDAVDEKGIVAMLDKENG